MIVAISYHIGYRTRNGSICVGLRDNKEKKTKAPGRVPEIGGSPLGPLVREDLTYVSQLSTPMAAPKNGSMGEEPFQG